ncbi:MAG TPA: hypothetical protein VMA32_00070 [Streptosporangiaceae bacterium]|nr:hypothetical protein [Streptosporangiaceae bacterium]
MNSITPSGAARRSEYWDSAMAAASELEIGLTAIRLDYEAGDISVREAADARVELLERHLDHLRELKRRYLDP